MESIIIDYNPLPIHKLSKERVEAIKTLNEEFTKIRKQYSFRINNYGT